MRDNSGFVGSLFDFNYDFKSPDTWVKLMCQVTVGVGIIVAIQSLDGTGCDRGWHLWNPSTWLRPPACTLRSIIRNVPVGFEEQKLDETIKAP